MTKNEKAHPKVVSRDEWLVARKKLLAREKEATRARDALNAERRRLPMLPIEKDYVFESSNGEASLLDLFEGRRQLIIYHFMFDPDWDEGCNGCSMVVDNMGHPAHLHARDTKIEPFKKRMGWTDFGVTTDEGESFGLSIFIRDGDRVFQTYFTSGRGVEHLGSNWSYLDLTPFGRQEDWEDSPEGWPQTRPYVWWRHHDRYGDE